MPEEPRRPRPDESRIERRPPRILVVEEEPLLLEAIVAAFHGRAEVLGTMRPHEAIASIEAGERYEAILVDIRMPEMDGFELHARIATICPAQARHVIFMTGGGLVSERRVPSLPNERLVKPVDLAVLEALRSYPGDG
ncbi:MAG TPA: response regulator [Polyangiaceae bacterium]|jgi:CheY-like chemotaxis protein